MGRFSYSERLVADNQHNISIYWLRKKDMLCDHCSQIITWSSRGVEIGSIGIEIRISEEEKFARLYYTITRKSNEQKDNFDYKILIISTDCYFGGKRYWFKCPTQGCGKMVAKLYQGKDIFACRHCYNLTYQSRNETNSYRKYPFRELLLHQKIEGIQKKMKRSIYKGVPTKKQMRIFRLQGKILKPHVDEKILNKILYNQVH